MRSIKQHWQTKCLTRWLKINIPCRFSKRTNRKHLSFYVLMRHVGNSISPRVSWHNLLEPETTSMKGRNIFPGQSVLFVRIVKLCVKAPHWLVLVALNGIFYFILKQQQQQSQTRHVKNVKNEEKRTFVQ